MTKTLQNKASSTLTGSAHLNRLPDKLIHYCGPLLEQLGLKVFVYRGFESEGNGCFYSNDIRFDNLTLDNLLASAPSFYEETKSLNHDRLHFVLWDEQTHAHEPYYQQYKNHNVWNGLNVYRRKENYLEIFTFAGLEQNTSIANFYLNHYEFLTRFITFFLMKIEASPTHTARFRFAFKDRLSELFASHPQHQGPKNQTPHKLMHDERIVINTISGDVCLSHRESACLRLLSGGKTAKEIARALDLSHRTIESYINNIRQKTGLRTRSELVDAYHKTIPFSGTF